MVPAEPDTRLMHRLAMTARAQGPALAGAIEQSLAYVRTRPLAESPFGPDGPVRTWAELLAGLEHLRQVLPRLGQDPDILRREFVWLEVRPNPLMTGYYEPELIGSLTPDPRFPVPIWGMPPDLRTVDLGRFHPRWQGQTLVYRRTGDGIAPFYSRHEIDVRDALSRNQRPIAWTRDPVDVFFLQIQGSGRLRLPDGQVRHVLYAGKNGHDYVSLGKVMIERNLIPKEEMSMQRIRSYLRDHPGQVRELLDTNPSYVFFRLAEAGPLGAMGRPLTPMVSMATDSAFLPLGTILAVDTDLPTTGGRREATFLALAQDRGGAIKGSRLDLFCGAGTEAEYLAGHLQSLGRVFLLLKK